MSNRADAERGEWIEFVVVGGQEDSADAFG